MAYKLIVGLFLPYLANAGLPHQYNVFFQHQQTHPSPSVFGGSLDASNIYGGSSFNSFAPVAQPFPAAPSFGSAYQPTPSDPQGLGCGRAPAVCQPTKYRSIDGSCNNMQNPIQGTPQTRYNRLLPPKYGDGISTPTQAVSGHTLPSARVVSLVLYPDIQKEDPLFTLNAMQYGQIITHDMSMIAGSTQAQPHKTKCCSQDGQLLELANSPDHCFPIVLPDDDPAYANSRVKCMNFVRTITDRDRNCVGGHKPAEQLTAVNHYLDLSIVYGNNDQMAQQLRTFQGGQMQVEYRNGQTWPINNPNASEVCFIRNPQEPCYQMGDSRVNQNTQLTVLHVILLREHNRLATELAKLNPHWDDERLYQEARKINIGEHQQISYYEWLPLFIGTENSLKNKIIWETKGHVNDYNPKVDATILNEHATAAFRYFHSLIYGHLDLVTEDRSSYGNIRMSDWFNRPAILEEGDNFDQLARGLNTQPELKADAYHDSEITQYLFRNGQPFGSDLKAIDVQRNRDHGLASYNSYREFCGLPRAHKFEDFLDVLSAENVKKLSSLYEHVEDVDLTVGASLEAHVPGTLAGPTFLCILTEQFYRTRVGDRYWFENEGDGGFTKKQLYEIRKASISRLMCDNGRHIKSMQPRGFERISYKNPVLPCNLLPKVDLNAWKESSAYGPAYNSAPVLNTISDFNPFHSNDYYFKKK